MSSRALAKRSRNFNDYEVDILLSLVRKYVRILECKKTDTTSINIKTNAWQQIAREYNSVNWREPRSAKVLKNKYINMKRRMRKTTVEVSNSITDTGRVSPPTIVELQLKDILDSQANGNDSLLDNDVVNGNADICYVTRIAYCVCNVSAKLHNNGIAGNTSTGKENDFIYQGKFTSELLFFLNIIHLAE